MTIRYHLEQIYKSNISSANLNEKGTWEFGVGPIIFVLIIIDWWRSSGTYWINFPSLRLRCHTDCFAQILCNLLFPDEEKVKEGLRETAHNSSPHLRNKAFMADQPSPAQKQHQVRATLAHIHPEGQEVLPNLILQSDWGLLLLSHPLSPTCSCLWFLIQRRWESLECHSLSRAHSLQIHGSSFGEEGLKRVCSAPQLGDQEKGSLLKRKLSVSDTEPSVVERVGSKHKKQGQRTVILRACYRSQCIISKLISS